MEVRINLRDQVLARFGNQLGALGDGLARTVMARALNHSGDKGRTQVKRALVRQTGIKYGMINSAMKTIRASASTLTYTLEAKGDETNISLFGARQGKAGVIASPWGKRQTFESTFMIGAYGGRTYKRTSKYGNRFPIKPVYGPNIAREMLKDETAATFKAGNVGLADRIAHEIARVLPQ
jgi:hypothetical protein